MRKRGYMILWCTFRVGSSVSDDLRDTNAVEFGGLKDST